MYHKKNVDYAYLLWKDFVYQVENKNVKKSNEMYYPCFTKLYGAILPNELTNKDIRNFESYKEYYAIASRAEPPKTKAGVKKKQIGSNKTTTYSTAKGKRLKTSTKIAKPAKKKQPVKKSMEKGLTLSSEVALTKAEQLKLVIERSKTQTHISHVSGSGADEGTSSIPGVLDIPTYDSDDEQISWKSSEEDNKDEVDNDHNDDDVDKDVNDDDAENPDDANQDDDDEQTDSDNDGDDFVHPKLSTHDDEARKNDEVNEEESEKESDDESNEESDEEVQGANTEEEEMKEEATHMKRTKLMSYTGT
ncbi:hypothetical protein Tco_1241048 [Tanacetum coccineum]